MTRLGREIIGENDILVLPLVSGQTSIELVPNPELLNRCVADGVDELADGLRVPPRVDSTRFVVIDTDGAAAIVSYRWAVLSKGGSA